MAHTRWTGPLAGMLGILCVAGFDAHATSTIARSFDEAVRRAARVVIAKVEDVRTERAGGEPPRLFTITVLSVQASLKGAGGSRIEVRQPGGQHGGWRAELVGGARFEKGERVLVLLHCPDPDAKDRCMLAGLADAKITVSSDAHAAELREQVTRVLAAARPPKAEPVSPDSESVPSLQAPAGGRR